MFQFTTVYFCFLMLIFLQSSTVVNLHKLNREDIPTDDPKLLKVLYEPKVQKGLRVSLHLNEMPKIGNISSAQVEKRAEKTIYYVHRIELISPKKTYFCSPEIHQPLNGDSFIYKVRCIIPY